MTNKCIAVLMSLFLAMALPACGSSNKGTESGNDKQKKTTEQSEKGNEKGNNQTEGENGEKAQNVGQTSTAQMGSTVIDATVTNLLRPLDAVMIVEYVTDLTYDPSDPVMYWSAMYYYLCIYGPGASGTSYDEDEQNLIVGADIVREAGRVLFGETVPMPQIPDSISRISLHDDGDYYIQNEHRPESYPEFVSAVKNEDGSYEVITQLTDEHGEILVNRSFHLTPKSSVNSLLGQPYYYTISTSGVG